MERQINKDFFTLPNSLVDDAMTFLGTRGIALYVVLARAESLLDYPSPIELAGKLKISLLKVTEILKQLRVLGLLNDNDLKAILGEEFE